MAALLLFSDGRPFAEGVTQYTTGKPGETDASRITIEVAVEGIRTRAAVDTGGLYFICDPELAGELGLPGDGALESKTLYIRGERWQGKLDRVEVELIAAEGRSLQVPATAFIPELQPGEQWPLPTFIGFQGFLDRIRFAVDPEEDKFYFSQLGQTE